MGRREGKHEVSYCVDWEEVKEDYLAGEPTRALVKKYGIPASTIQNRARRDSWLPVEERMARSRRLTKEEKAAGICSIREWLEEKERQSGAEREETHAVTGPIEAIHDFLVVLGRELRKDFLHNYRVKNMGLLEWNKALIRSPIMGFSDPEAVIRTLEEEAEKAEEKRIPWEHRFNPTNGAVVSSRRISEEKKRNIREMLLDGCTNKDIACAVEVSRGTVEIIRSDMVKAGEMPAMKRGRGALEKEAKDKMLRMLAAGAQAKEVAMECEVGMSTVYRVKKELRDES
jgi:transposase